MCISHSTKNKAAAYEVAKYLSFGVEGTNARFSIIDANTKTGLSYEDVRDGAVLNIGDYIWDVCGGQISVSTYQSDFTSELAGKMNKYVSDAYAKIEEVVNK